MDIHYYPGALDRVVREDPRYEEYVIKRCTQMKDAARAIFDTLQRKDNEARVSRWTPPKYAESFVVVYDKDSATGHVRNIDPGWFVVEFGAHHHNKHKFYQNVPKYSPLRRALDLMIATAND